MNLLTLKTAPIVLFIVLLASSSTPAAVINPAEVKEIAAVLPAHPAGFGQPISNRDAWAKLASQPSCAKLLREAEATAKEPLPESPDELYLDFSKTGNRQHWEKVAGIRRGRVATFALAECLEDRRQFLGPLEETIRAICAERTWVMPAHDSKLDNFQGRVTEMDLGATMLAWDLATADYLVGEKLSKATRLLLRENLERRIFGPFRDMVEGRKKEIYWLSVENNWNAVCLAGITGSALATLDLPDEGAFFVAAARHYIKSFLRGFTPDSYCSEGLGYWNYGFGYFVMLAEAIRQATHSKVDLLADPSARAPALFGVRSEILNRIYPSISDCSPGTQPDENMMNLLCRRFGMQARACAGAEPVPPRRPLYAAAMYAFLPPQLPVVSGASADAESPLRSWFKDGGVLICRPAANGPEFALALKGGHNAEHHNHNDVGTFMVVSGRAMVICDPGAEVYTARTFSARRYESDVLNSFGHPVPVIAGQLQRTGAEAKGEVLRTDFSDARDLLELNLRSAYAVSSLKRLERTFIYQRKPAASVTVADQVEFDAPETFETALITWSPWQRVGDRELLIGDENGAVRVKIESAGQRIEVKSKRLEADVRTPKHAERIGLALSLPVKSASVALIITPVVLSERQK